MKNILLVICMLVINNSSFAQEAPNQIEFTPFLRWDNYSKFNYAINSVNSNTVGIKGMSWGIDATYKFSITNNFYLKAGLGYYKYSFNKIDQINSLLGRSDNRIIEYIPPDPWAPAIVYTTDKYWYNCIVGTIGIERQLAISKSVQLLCGVNIRNYYSYSQHYHIVYPSPQGTNYKQKHSRYFGFSADLNASLQKKMGKINLGPTFSFPIYNLWKQDEVFPQEENRKARNKWFSGVGIGLTCNYSLSKIHKK